MLKRLYSLLFFLGLSYNGFSQEKINLVPNPSFEEIVKCPNNRTQINYAEPWYAAAVPGGISSELYSKCVLDLPFDSLAYGFSYPCNNFGCMQARTGDNYAGIGIVGSSQNNMNVAEFISSPLFQPLIRGDKYCLEFYCSVASSSTGYVSSLQLLFHPDSLLRPYDFLPFRIAGTQDSILALFEPVMLTSSEVIDSLSWQKYSTTYIAKGGEQFFSIGNFIRGKQTVFTPWSGPVDSSNIIQYIFLDDISITHCPDPVVLPPYLKIYPNPTANRVTVATNTLQLDENARLEIIDMFGRRVHNENLVYSNEGWELDLYGLQAGMYYVRFWVNGELRAAEKLVKSVPTSR